MSLIIMKTVAKVRQISEIAILFVSKSLETQKKRDNLMAVANDEGFKKV